MYGLVYLLFLFFLKKISLKTKSKVLRENQKWTCPFLKRPGKIGKLKLENFSLNRIKIIYNIFSIQNN